MRALLTLLSEIAGAGDGPAPGRSFDRARGEASASYHNPDPGTEER